jgi:hypothetical protein
MSAHETAFTCSDSGIRPRDRSPPHRNHGIAFLLQEGAQMRAPQAEASALLHGVRRKAGHDEQAVALSLRVQFSRAPIPVSTRKSGFDWTPLCSLMTGTPTETKPEKRSKPTRTPGER